jgi:hypothetical protein
MRRHLSYANVMVTLLAFVVLGGTAFAVAKLDKNSVGSKQLKAGAVHTADVADDAITAEKLAPGAAGATTVRSIDATIPLTCTESNPVGSTYFLSCSGKATVTAPCESGEHATGGGYRTPPASTGPQFSGASVTSSRPEPTSGAPTAWSADVTGSGSNSGSSPGLAHPPDPTVTVYALCSS